MEKQTLEVLIHERNESKRKLEKCLFDFVKEYGEDCTEEHIQNFGLDEEGCEVTKVFDFYNHGGCYFTVSECINTWRETHLHNAFHCLYIVSDKYGNEWLKYYEFYNIGCEFDEDSESTHDFVSELDIIEIDYIISAIHLIV